MKIAILSDIHANLPALRAVLSHLDGVMPDRVVVAGDIVNRGPDPRACLDLMLEKADRHRWRLMRGNHEDYVLHVLDRFPRLADWEKKVCAHTLWTRERVAGRLDAIAAWPDRIELTGPDGGLIRVVHASMHGNRVGLYEFMDDAELHDKTAPHVPVLCTGHTHIPFVRRLGDRLILNAGAVGMPFDRDPRASYAVITWTEHGWQPEIIRVPYDLGETEQRYRATGYLEAGGPMVPLILQELRESRSWLGPWHRDYEPDVAAGRMSLEDSVERILAARGG